MDKSHDPFAVWLAKVEAIALDKGLDGLEDREFDLYLHHWQVEQLVLRLCGNGKKPNGSKRDKVIKVGIPAGAAGIAVTIWELLKAVV